MQRRDRAAGDVLRDHETATSARRRPPSLALLLVPAVLAHSAPARGALPGDPTSRIDRARYARDWHVRLPRETMLAAWERLKALEIPGVPVDQRFRITGREYYVGPEGSDAADGSRRRPWRTLAHAASRLGQSTVVYLMPGVYYGPVTITTKASAGSPAALRALEPGTVFVTYADEWVAAEKAKVGRVTDGSRRAVVDAKGKPLHYPPLICVSGGTYVEISGLHLVGVRDRLPQNLYSECGVLFTGGGGPGCRVLYNEIENVGHCGVKEQGHGGHSFLVEGNYIHDLGQTRHDHCYYSSARDVVVRKNLLLNSAGLGINCHSLRGPITVTHNVIGGNAAWGMCSGGPDAVIVHNVFCGNRRGGVCLYRGHCEDNVVKNNVFLERTGPAIPYDNLGGKKPGHTPSGNLVDFNCLAPGTELGRPMPGNVHGDGNFTLDPRFAGAEKLDFRPRRGSPLVDAGDPVGREQRGRAPDVGLYELGSR